MSRFAINGNNVHFISLGCPRNLVDTEVMLGLLMQAGYQVVSELEQADFIVVNTCGFLEASRQESRDVISEAVSGKKESAKVIVTGCMVNIEQKFPGVDYLLGAGDVEQIVEALRATEKGAAISEARSYLEAGEVPRTLSTPKHYAYLKIAEGCRKRCSYCIIPDIKGKLRSKPEEQILREFRSLLARGVKEIILIAQDLGDYGKDFGKRDALAPLLKEMLKTEGDYWIRLLYLYPDEITDELIELMKQDERICRYLDMPIQHINDAMLKAMRRKTNGGQIRDVINRLRRELPDIVIRTSLIVGFPGESQEQFEELVEFVDDYELDNVGVFKFSKEEGAHAASLPGQIDESIKEERHERLMGLQQCIVEERLESFIGKTIEVVVEGYHPESELLIIARHKGQCPEIDGVVLINDCAHVDAFGERYMVEITGVAGYDLVGKSVKRINKLALV